MAAAHHLPEVQALRLTTDKEPLAVNATGAQRASFHRVNLGMNHGPDQRATWTLA